MEAYTLDEIGALIKHLEGLNVLGVDSIRVPMFRIIQARSEVGGHYISELIQKATMMMGPRMDYWDIYLIIDLLECPLDEVPYCQIEPILVNVVLM